MDFQCSICSESYQLKSQRLLNLKRIADGSYSALVAALKSNSAPNLFILNYSDDWCVRNLYLIPSLFFTLSVIEKRRPLSQSARRSGWVGCNLLLSSVPAEARIPLVQNGTIFPCEAVREQYKSFEKLKRIEWEARSWTLDVLQAIKHFESPRFALQDVYDLTTEFSERYPRNRNVKAKLRQQLQVLRDLGYIEFLGHGKYRKLNKLLA